LTTHAVTLLLSSARLKKFFCGTVFGFYFQNTIPRKNASAHSPVMAQHSAGPLILSFFIFIFPWDSIWILLFFQSTESHERPIGF